MKITVIGTGYVGLVAGACFADNGNQVTCIDIDAQKIELLKSGAIPIYEPGLEPIVKRAQEQGRLHFTTSYEEAIPSSEIIFLAVGTPAQLGGEPDVSALQAAAREVGRHLSGYAIIVNKSTVPIGSHLKVREWIQEKAKYDFDVASNPEFLKEGSAVNDFLKPDRVIIGTDRESVFKTMSDLYSTFCRQGNPILWMDTVSAEITKYACNAFLATRISFMNELSRLCEKVGGDVEEVRKGMITDVRIGKHFLFAGPGYGGSCFPKDVKALISTGERYHSKLGIVSAVEAANTQQKKHIVDTLELIFPDGLSQKTVGIWGLAFKPNTDDMREAPSLVLISELVKKGAKVQVFDPIAMKKAMEILGDRVVWSTSSYEAAEKADVLVLITEWNEFRNLDFNRVRLGMRQPILYDTRNIYPPKKMKEMGFRYIGLGRGQYTVRTSI